jgi:hypothetical protein
VFFSSSSVSAGVTSFSIWFLQSTASYVLTDFVV